MFHHGVRQTIVMLAVLAFLAAGCGSEDAAGSASGDEDTTTTIAVNADTEAEADDGTDPVDDAAELDLAAAQQSAEEFSQCLRDAGVDVPDLAVTAEGDLDLGGLIATVDPADPAVQQAIFSCQGSLDGGLAGSLNQILESQTFADALVSFSQCVRDEGYDVADLTFAAVVGAALGNDLETAGEDAVSPILASAMDLDPQDPEVIGAIDGCVVLISNSLGDLGLGG